MTTQKKSVLLKLRLRLDRKARERHERHEELSKLCAISQKAHEYLESGAGQEQDNGDSVDTIVIGVPVEFGDRVLLCVPTRASEQGDEEGDGEEIPVKDPTIDVDVVDVDPEMFQTMLDQYHSGLPIDGVAKEPTDADALLYFSTRNNRG